MLVMMKAHAKAEVDLPKETRLLENIASSDNESNDSIARSRSKLGVIMPVFNEIATIEVIVGMVLELECVHELIIVDDFSTDGSWEAITRIAHRDHRIKMFRHLVNRGKGAAVKTGFSESSAPVLVIQDADLEYVPKDLPIMLSLMDSGRFDVIYGSRFARRSLYDSPNWHVAGNRLLTKLCNLVTGLQLTDEATCYKMFRRELLSRINLVETGFGFCVEFTTKIAHLGLRVGEVPIRYKARTRAEGKKIRAKDGWNALGCLFKYGLFKTKYRHQRN